MSVTASQLIQLLLIVLGIQGGSIGSGTFSTAAPVECKGREGETVPRVSSKEKTGPYGLLKADPSWYLEGNFWVIDKRKLKPNNALAEKEEKREIKFKLFSTSLGKEKRSVFGVVICRREKETLIHKANYQISLSELEDPLPLSKHSPMEREELTHVILKLLQAWKEPLSHFNQHIEHHQELPDDSLSKAKQISNMVHELKTGVEKMQSMGIISNSLNGMASSEDTGLSISNEANMMSDSDFIHCFRRDSNKVQSYLKILKCRWRLYLRVFTIHVWSLLCQV
ncbi:hypothetical protein EK904_001501 [Melospiza melodia maxima]|nr:hypothetical protein EK904_001501 [Melospiza melodia maxima]